jgi:hypothetical protein
MLAVLALVAAMGGAGDQPLREGAQVRVLIAEDPGAATASRGKTPAVGRVRSVQGESMTVATGRGAVVVAFKDIARLEVSHRSRNLKRGALIGGLVGFAVVTALSVATFDEEDDYSISTGESFLIGAIVGAPAGGLIGLGVGALAPAWHEVPVPKAVSRRVALGITIRF